MRIFLLAIIFSNFFSCNNKNSISQPDSNIAGLDTIDCTRQNKAKQYFSEQAISLNLPSIRQNADSFELRLWISSMLVEHCVIILVYKDSLWYSYKINYHVSENGGKINYVKEKVESEALTKSLVDSLMLIDFSNLKSQNEIKDFKDNIADGVSYNLEIATKKSYRILTYHCPEHFAKTEINNRKFLDIVRLLDKHFHFLTIPCSI